MNLQLTTAAFALACTLFLLQPIHGAAEEIVRVVAESPTACQSPCNRTAVVFIHGILGSRETWQNSDTDHYWPKMLATDPDIGNKLEVFRVDYDSFLFSAGPAFVDVLKMLETKLDELFMQRKYPKAIPIGHSLGGNIARAYLMHIKAKYGHRALSTFRLIFTLGTPMEGSTLSAIARFATFNQQMRVLQPIRVNDFQQLLNATLVDIINKHHQVYCPRLNFYSGFEQEPVSALGIVVTEESATKYADLSKGFERNHINLVKPPNRDDPVYVWVKESMMACMSERSPCDDDLTPDCGRLPEGFPNPNFEVTRELTRGAPSR